MLFKVFDPAGQAELFNLNLGGSILLLDDISLRWVG